MSRESGQGSRSKLLMARFAASGFVYGVIGLIWAAIAAALVAFVAHEYVSRPGEPGEPVPVLVPRGATGNAVGMILEDEGLVEHAFFFRLALWLDKSDKFIRHGYYEIPRGLSPNELLALIQEGPKAPRRPGSLEGVVKVTIPEGLTIGQLAQVFDDPGAFIQAASDPDLAARIGADVSSLEGYLMPNTYYFDEVPTGRAVVERLVGQFEREYAKLLAEFPEGAERNRHEVVTVASLVEEEAKVDEERPLIAAVIYNRLDRGMPLEMDCTLQYALRKYGERMLDEDKEVDSPYNTYRYAGLPPGPISSPGVASLRAALQPADSKYLYFVGKGDGQTHRFSYNLAQHNRNVIRYHRAMARERQALEKGKQRERERE